MKLVQRQYKPGDEASINKLYKLITGKNRSLEQYKWEWIDTWDGQGSIWLAFDEQREKDDQLMMQYSLIPIPLSIFGELYLAGKTENCMAHPECRGTGAYYRHEKLFFKEAKKRFQIFFTTTGNVAKGAPGAVRRKLGYRAFDSWTTLFFIVDKKAFPTSMSNNKQIKPLEIMSLILKPFLYFYFWLLRPKQSGVGYQIFDERNAPLQEIENLWEKNKRYYGITVDRSSLYLDWRINKNPYFQHKYLLFREKGELKGFVIFYKHKRNTVRIVDIFAEKKEGKIFRKMIKQLVVWSKENNAEKIICTTSSSSKAIRRVFYSCGFLSFINFRRLKNLWNKQNLSQQLPFHVFISEQVLKKHSTAYKANNWYLTELVFEGREN